jgi:hypothetical protein
MKKAVSVILFLSSYIPLFTIIIIQNFFSLFEKVKDILEAKDIMLLEMFTKSDYLIKGIVSILSFDEFWIITFFVIVITTLLFELARLLNKLNDTKPFKVKIKEIKNVNHELVTSYFAIYIFPFITLNLTQLSGIIQFLFLGTIIGYVYIKNELFYVNPVLNIIFKFNIYNAKMIYEDENSGKIVFNSFLLSQKSKEQLNENYYADVRKRSEEFYIEI